MGTRRVTGDAITDLIRGTQEKLDALIRVRDMFRRYMEPQTEAIDQLGSLAVGGSIFVPAVLGETPRELRPRLRSKLAMRKSTDTWRWRIEIMVDGVLVTKLGLFPDAASIIS